MVSRVGTRPSQGPHRPCGRRVAAGPSAGSSQHSAATWAPRERGERLLWVLDLVVASPR